MAAGMTVNELVTKFGKSCAYPGSLQSELAVLLLTEDYEAAVRTNIMAGGDSCSRASFIGAYYISRKVDQLKKVDFIT